MKNVSKKLLAAIKQVGGKVKKTGYNGFSKYHYITESDINEAVLPALLDNGLILTTSVESYQETPSSVDSKNRFASVMLVHKIIDTESGEVLEFKSAGTGADSLDKSIYKAITGSFKYFALKLFLISGDDADPENDVKEVQSSQAPKGLSKPGLAKPASVAPVAPVTPTKTQGLFAKKAEASAPVVEAKKPTFGVKKPVQTEPKSTTLEMENQTSEEDVAY